MKKALLGVGLLLCIGAVSLRNASADGAADPTAGQQTLPVVVDGTFYASSDATAALPNDRVWSMYWDGETLFAFSTDEALTAYLAQRGISRVQYSLAGGAAGLLQGTMPSVIVADFWTNAGYGPCDFKTSINQSNLFCVGTVDCDPFDCADWNDQISSLKANGASLTIFEDTGYNGHHLFIAGASIYDLSAFPFPGGGNWNDKISSIHFP